MNAMQVSDLLKSRGIRPTPQRIGVYQFLYDNRVHASADMIYEALSPQYPSFSRTTIYNSIKTLVENGLIRSVCIEGEYVRYDANIADHGHFKCLSCGKVYDFTTQWNGDLPEDLDGFEVRIKDAFFYGTCKACAKNLAVNEGNPFKNIKQNN